MITLPYVDVDDGKNYQGLVLELIELFDRYPQFHSKYDNDMYQKNEHPFFQSQIVDRGENKETLAIILKEMRCAGGNGSGIENHRGIIFPIIEFPDVVRDFLKVCEKRGWKVHPYSMEHIKKLGNLQKLSEDYREGLEKFNKLKKKLMSDDVQD